MNNNYKVLGFKAVIVFVLIGVLFSYNDKYKYMAEDCYTNAFHTVSNTITDAAKEIQTYNGNIPPVEAKIIGISVYRTCMDSSDSLCIIGTYDKRFVKYECEYLRKWINQLRFAEQMDSNELRLALNQMVDIENVLTRIREKIDYNYNFRGDPQKVKEDIGELNSLCKKYAEKLGRN